MDFSITNGWVSPAVHIVSPNFNSRPLGAPIDMLVIHNISLPPGNFGGEYVQAFFCNQLNPSEHPYFAEIASLQVSAHCLIERTGRLTQFVSFDDRAWHAGVSCFDGVANCNDYAIGVELEGTDDLPYELMQYQTLAALSAKLMQVYPGITRERIIGHSDIAPSRKTDPGPAFNWGYYAECLATFIARNR